MVSLASSDRGEVEDGRGGQIRTDGPLHPMQVRYRAAPRPDGTYYNTIPSQIQAAGDDLVIPRLPVSCLNDRVHVTP